MIQKTSRDISSLTLHILAMAAMLCDHLWATVIPGNAWMTWVGRLAYPIFAFLLAEGYYHTRDVEKYRKRVLVGAVLSELPFNLMYSGSWIYPFHQNVLWTFVLALSCMKILDGQKGKGDRWMGWILRIGTVLGFFLLGQITMVDYGGYGILMVLVFWLFRGNSWNMRLLQFVGMYWINWEMMQGMQVPLMLFGMVFEIPQQGFAVLALLPIWAYKGRQGPHNKKIQAVCYGFYPVHMLILGLLSQ